MMCVELDMRNNGVSAVHEAVDMSDIAFGSAAESRDGFFVTKAAKWDQNQSWRNHRGRGHGRRFRS